MLLLVGIVVLGQLLEFQLSLLLFLLLLLSLDVNTGLFRLANLFQLLLFVADKDED